MLNVHVASHVLLPLIVGPCCLYLQLDPVICIQIYLINEANWRPMFNLAAIPLRLSVLGTSYEMARMFSWLICFMTLAFHLLINCVTYLKKRSIRITFWGGLTIDEYFARFSAFEIAITSSYIFINPMIALVMFVRFLGTVLCNFVALKNVSRHPFPSLCDFSHIWRTTPDHCNDHDAASGRNF